MLKAKFENLKTHKVVSSEIKSKFSINMFEPQYCIEPANEKLCICEVSKEVYDQLNVPETKNERRDYLKRMELLKKDGKDKLPENWKELSLCEQCAYLDELLKELIDYDSQYNVNVTLQFKGKEASAFVQFTDEEYTCDYEAAYVRCNLIRRDLNMTLDKLPEAFREWAKYNYDEEEAEEESKEVEMVAYGSTFSEALTQLFDRIVLLFYGYECLYKLGDYIDYCMEKFGDDGDDDANNLPF